MSPGPISRRQLLRYGLVGGALAIGAAAAGPAFAGTRTATSTGGGVVTVWADRPQSFDPAIGWDSCSWEAVTQLLFVPLLQFDAVGGTPAPAAAAAMPTYSDDRLEVTLALRPDVTFHNGRPVVAEDYVYSWTRVLNADLASWASSYLLSVAGAQEVYDGTADTVTGLEVLDPHTLRITLVNPDITFDALLCQPYMAAVPSEVVEELGDDQFGRTPVGTGPFRIDAWDDQRRQATFSRFDGYFVDGAPVLDQVTYRWGITPELQVLQLQGGAADIAGYGLTANQSALLRSQGAEGSKYVEPVPLLAAQWVALNVTKGPLQDLEVRRALDLGTDRDQLARAAFGTVTPWTLPFPEALADYERVASPSRYDPDEAERLVSRRGGARIVLEMIHGGDNSWPAVAQILQQQWQRIGVDLKITAMGKPAFDWAIYAGQGDLYGTQSYMTQPSALDLVRTCWVTGGSMNYTMYSNPEVDELAVQAQSAATVAESNAALAQVEQLLKDDVSGLFIGSLNFLAARSPDLEDFEYRGEYGVYYDRLRTTRKDRR